MSFDNGLEATNVFVNISRTLYKVSSEGPIFRFKQTTFLVNFYTTYVIFEAIGNKEMCLMVKICLEQIFLLEFHKNLY